MNFKLNYLKKNKGVYIFSDPGGAKPCLAFLLLNKISNFKAISDRVYNFYNEFGINVSCIEETKLSNFIYEYKPDYIFTGTSYTSNIEKIALKKGIDFNIPSFTYIDHSTNLEERFKLKDNCFLPTNILVSENKTKKNILENSFFESCSIIKINNPYLNYLRNWKPKFNRSIFFKNLNIEPKKKIILIALDPISNLNGIEEYGYDEISGFLEIKSVINDLNFDYSYIFKPHPNQNLTKIKKILGDSINFVSPHVDTNHLLYYSDTIIGFFSNILIEAKAFRKIILRYRPEGFKFDPFNHKKIGTIVNKDTLHKYL